jgi:hypothetical protein
LTGGPNKEIRNFKSAHHVVHLSRHHGLHVVNAI